METLLINSLIALGLMITANFVFTQVQKLIGVESPISFFIFPIPVIFGV